VGTYRTLLLRVVYGLCTRDDWTRCGWEVGTDEDNFCSSRGGGKMIKSSSRSLTTGFGCGTGVGNGQLMKISSGRGDARVDDG